MKAAAEYLNDCQVNHSSDSSIFTCFSLCTRLFVTGVLSSIYKSPCTSCVRCLCSQHPAVILGSLALPGMSLLWEPRPHQLLTHCPLAAARTSAQGQGREQGSQSYWDCLFSCLIFSLQMHFCSLVAYGHFCWLPKWFWGILGWTLACIDVWEVLGVLHHQLSSAPHTGTRLLGEILAPVCPMGPFATCPGCAASWQETQGLQAEIPNGHRQFCCLHRLEAMLMVRNILWYSHIALLCLTLPFRIASHGERMIYAGWRS